MTDYRYGRKLHGIQKDVHEKISDWISTIQDEKVKELAKANTIFNAVENVFNNTEFN